MIWHAGSPTRCDIYVGIAGFIATFTAMFVNACVGFTAVGVGLVLVAALMYPLVDLWSRKFVRNPLSDWLQTLVI